MANYSYDKMWGLALLVIGLGLIVWGISYFIFPALLVFTGFMLISHGLQLRKMPPLRILVVKLMSQFR